MRVVAALRGRLLAVLAGLAAALSAMPAPITASELDGFAGTWVRSHRERDDAAREAEIVRVTEAMSFPLRGIARSMMRRRIRPHERYEIGKNGEGAWIRDADGEVTPVDGRPHIEQDGSEVTARFTVEGAIEQSWKHEESHGVTVWRLADGGDRLVVSETIYNSNFEGPMRYVTTYQRAGPE
jgi:hypothetical protein